MWNPQKAGYLLRNILGSKVVKTNLKGLPYQLFCYHKAEGIQRGQGSNSESASFLIAGFQKDCRVIYGCKFNRCRSGSLNQEQKPLVFASGTLSIVAWNYTVTERECLSVIWALKKFRTYLRSLPIKFITYHAALTRLTNGKNLPSGMIRWTLKLAVFNREWEHHSGTENAVADVLSRIGEKVNCAIIRNLVLSSREQLIEEQRKDLELGHIYRYLENL
ncbi:retrovirus-related Pol polyprotein from transposon 17.6 [Trichonephila clavipes]|uniref:Retrovirus-related Pol polyprotein from transposon 17.6 n=1 Tax=Trichonephila clavipes TaxID=2585209 RepID=A0A8X6VRY3_TRICX|nr:retrovirus-related Pol polyprotein from transposon 17.6 [Trichonephila clavipes]